MEQRTESDDPPILGRKGKKRSPDHLATREAPNREIGGLWRTKTAHAEYHRVRFQFRGVVVLSRGMVLRTQAEAMLSQLRTAASPQGRDPEHELRALVEALSTASVATAGESPKASVDDAAQHLAPALYFAVCIDARRWIGKSLTSPTMRSLEEALEMRRRVVEAEQEGWDAVRELWAQWLTAERPARWRRRHNQLDVEKRLAAADTVSKRLRMLECSRSAGPRRAGRPLGQRTRPQEQREAALLQRAAARLGRCALRAERALLPPPRGRAPPEPPRKLPP